MLPMFWKKPTHTPTHPPKVTHVKTQGGKNGKEKKKQKKKKGHTGLQLLLQFES